MTFVVIYQQKPLLTTTEPYISLRCRVCVDVRKYANSFQCSLRFADSVRNVGTYSSRNLTPVLTFTLLHIRWRSWLTWWWVRCGRYRFWGVVPQTVPIVCESSSLSRYHRSRSCHPSPFIRRVEVRHGLGVVRVVVRVHHVVVVPRGCRR